ncbi:conserved Plasmodium protein, unknown function [Plasmodium gallinaceum]|uniref:Uncharacterized protein n=1 Tax=Plasmodium gallinaceum TaxID=5849 RepID=A0A1J1GSW1_PLAGA|nr:conserved Plasmodium protein, unknown function [Plasmodium gallinaceum]CRG95570.1 conserved Plasmodium protein, unknown function [Plasmodium gallinaceum]
MYKNKVLFVFLFSFFYFFVLFYVNGKGENKNILSSMKNENNKNTNLDHISNLIDMDKIKQLIAENKIEEANNLLKEMQQALKKEETDEHKDNNEIDKYEEVNNKMFDNLISASDLHEMMKFYMYLQNLLNSKSESSEKKMVKTFLRKTIQKMKDNENNKEKKSIDDIIKDTEGHKEMLEKLADVMKIDREKLKDEEVKNKLNQILIGMLKFIEYTNNNELVNALMDEIEIKEVKAEDGASKPKIQVNINNSKTHLEMLQKASNFMGLEINQEDLQKLTSNNKWYENFLNNILNSSDEL